MKTEISLVSWLWVHCVCACVSFTLVSGWDSCHMQFSCYNFTARQSYILYCPLGSTPVGSLRRSLSQASQLSDLSQTSSKFSRSAGNLAGGYNGGHMRGELSSARSAPSIPKQYGGEKPRYYDVSHYQSEGELGGYQNDTNMANQKDILLQRNEDEGFGFVILSTSNMIGSTVGELLYI